MRDWGLHGTAPGAHLAPGPWMAEVAWTPAVAPFTVAQALDHPLDRPGDFDDRDWWTRATFTTAGPGRLTFEGLATLAEVWVDGTKVLESRNMFRTHTVPLDLPAGDHELVIRFRALTPELAAKRPRPRWKTALVASQNLRWIRTTLLGRIPGWTPPLPAVGPWRPVTWQDDAAPALRDVDLRTWAEGATGRLTLQAAVNLAGMTAARLTVGDRTFPLKVVGATLSGEGTWPDAPLWWPHTHGEPTLHDASVEVEAAGTWHRFPLGKVGFKAVTLDRAEGRVQLVVNGRPIFTRGACWTTADARSLVDATRTRAFLELAREAGANLVRVGGTMVYESEAFYTACDELGLMVWQDFMFANFDYPFGDADFRADVEAEVTQQLDRLQKHVSVAVHCGSSEIHQQAAMLGFPPEGFASDFFDRELPATCAALHPGIPYFPSTPCEGALPFHTAVGLTHYYGVGAYRRPLADLRVADVKFTPECLGFSQVPEPETVQALAGDGPLVPHQPLWKARVPRDSGAGWDFEDVRDHYLREGFGVDPVALRSADPTRYLACSRVVPGELQRRAFAEWRRAGSRCGGALVWLWQDLWPGAGWGLVDSHGRPKAAWYLLKRAWAARSVHLSDEGLDGHGVHLVNESAEAMEATLELELWTGTRTRVAQVAVPVSVPPFTTDAKSAEALLGHFADTTYAYRFGPPRHRVVLARLRDAATGALLSEDACFPAGMDLPTVEGAGWQGTATASSPTEVVLDLSATAFLQSVSFEVPGWRPDHAYFHLAPGETRRVAFRATEPMPRVFKAHVGALNTAETLTVRLA
jgi:beta-mannosidase